ncbi:MAG: nucleotidyl transferase AbiEii/AbiGii toxin family protein [Alphaproteobacteria bacterium]|nr:nucleotidyl transferase AbiEii/AbiGii toxin family protein [Alphaproteobacteria bacterium]
MTPRAEPPKNMGASVRARLTDKARSRGDDVQLILLRFAIERLIYRLAQSRYSDQFILKGAMLFSLWAPVPYRSTGDLDLLGQGDPAPERIVTIFRELCVLDVPDDGLAFDPDSVAAEQMRADEEYQGVRVELNTTLAGARLRIQIDIGFGDIVTPEAQVINYPTLLDFPEAQLRAYPPETVVAEKLEALVSLGMRNSRMKDFFDLWVMAKTFAFDGAVLTEAVRATFTRRQTPFPTEPPIALTPSFANDASKQAQWRGFLRRTSVAMAPEPLPELLVFIAGFAMPVLEAARDGNPFDNKWLAGGSWL